MNEKDVIIKYLTNCAVLIKYGTEGFLIDGLFSDRQPFNRMDEETESDILSGKGMYAGINNILVTHCHNDHYNARRILAFLENNPKTRLILPFNAKIRTEETRNEEMNLIFLKGEEGEVRQIMLPGVEIEYMKIGHLTFNYPEHYCINIVTEDKNILITADMDFSMLELLSKFKKKGQAIIFINHIALWHKKWRDQLIHLDYNNIFFYHLPDEDRDLFEYREKAIRYWQKHKEEFPNGTLLGYDV